MITCETFDNICNLESVHFYFSESYLYPVAGSSELHTIAYSYYISLCEEHNWTMPSVLNTISKIDKNTYIIGKVLEQ